VTPEAGIAVAVLVAGFIFFVGFVYFFLTLPVVDHFWPEDEPLEPENGFEPPREWGA